MTRESLRRQYPNEPWKWDRRWTTGVITDGGLRGVVFIWIFSLVWCIAPTVLILLQLGVMKGHPPPIVFTLVFIGAGVLLLSMAIYQTLRAVRFGKSELTLAPFPVRPGEPLNASVRLHKSLAGVQDVVAKLQCVRRERRSTGKNQTTFDKIQWEDEQHATLARKQDDTVLQATFDPPADALESNDADRNNVLLWRLIVRGARPGINYQATFELPMFRRAAGDVPAPVARVATIATPSPVVRADSHDTGLPTRELIDQRIGVRLLAGKAFSVDFPPARRVGSALMLSIFALGMDAVAIASAWPNMMFGRYDFSMGGIFELVFRLPFILVFGLFGLLMTAIALSMWFVRTTATVDRDGLTVERRMIGFYRKRTIERSKIVSVTPNQTMTSGDRVFYSIDAKTDDGKTFEFGSGIEGRHVADRLAAAIWDVVRSV